MTDWITIPARARGERPSIGASISWRLTHAGRRAAFVTVGKDAMGRLGWPQKGRVVVAHDPAGTMLRAALSKNGRALDGKGGFGVFSTSLPWLPPSAPSQIAKPVEFRIEDGALIVVLPDWARKPAEPPKPQPRPAMPLRQAEPEPKPIRWTDERIAYIREHYPTAEPLPDIVRFLNALPGDPVTEPQVRGYAGSVLHLSRPVSKAAKREPTMLDVAPPDARDILEAKQQLRKGVPVRDVAEEFGQPIKVVVRWHEEVLAERRAA